jgi:hypothetical protein
MDRIELVLETSAIIDRRNKTRLLLAGASLTLSLAGLFLSFFLFFVRLVLSEETLEKVT